MVVTPTSVEIRKKMTMAIVNNVPTSDCGTGEERESSRVITEMSFESVVSRERSWRSSRMSSSTLLRR